jgi:hypothetical protein
MGKATPERIAYLIQKRHAKDRGIEWLFTFERWVLWWKSQLGANWINLRGRRRGQYVMSRFNDVGPYVESNIKCTLHEINSVEGLVGKKRRASTIEKMRIAATGQKHTTATRIKLSRLKQGKPWSAARRAAYNELLFRKKSKREKTGLKSPGARDGLPSFDAK